MNPSPEASAPETRSSKPAGLEPPLSDQALLERLAAGLLAGLFELELYEELALRLLAQGEAGPAARWQGWSLVPPNRDRLLKGLGEASFLLLPAERAISGSTGPTAWQALVTQLDAGAEPALLEAAVRAVLAEPLPTRAVVLPLCDRLLAVGMPQASLGLLVPLLAQGEPDSALCNRLAWSHRAIDDAGRAELWCRRSLAIDRAQPLMWFQLARLLVEGGTHDEGLECAEAGLMFAPSHSWGLKLRARALATAGGWRTLDQLGQVQALPPDEVFMAGLARLRPAARTGLGRQQPLEPPLDLRLRLRGLLRDLKGPVLLVHGRTAEALVWLAAMEVLPMGLQVLPVASRDPLRVTETLAAAGLAVAAERSRHALWQLERADLVVLERPTGCRLPLHLGPWLRRSALVLAPSNLVWLPEREIGRLGGWVLFRGLELEREGHPMTDGQLPGSFT